MDGQQEFIYTLSGRLRSRGFEPRTLGVTDYDWDAPMKAIRRLMLESYGLIAVALRRAHIQQGNTAYRSDTGSLNACSLNGQWLTSPWVHIESAMAYQIGLPILILREEGVMEEGLLETGVAGTYMHAFSLSDSLDGYSTSGELDDQISQWALQVKCAAEMKFDHL